MGLITLLLIVVAFAFAAVELFRSRFGSLEAWAVFLLALALLVGRLA